MYESSLHIICDPYLDAIYLKSLKRFKQEHLIEKLKKYLAITLNESIDKNRSFEVLIYLEEFYKEQSNKQVIEDMLIELINEKLKISILPFCTKLQALEILQAIALNADDNQFNRILDLLVDVILGYKKTSSIEERKKPKGYKYEERQLIKGAHRKLFGFFKVCYLEYPPNRLISVVKALIKSLECKIYNIVLLTLKFLRHLTHEQDFHLCIEGWNTPTYFCGYEWKRYNFSIFSFITAVMPFLTFDSKPEIISSSLNLINAVCQSHYGLYTQDLSAFMDRMLELLSTACKKYAFDIIVQIQRIIQVIFTQGAVLSASEPGIDLNFSVVISLFEVHMIILNLGLNFFALVVDEFKKSKLWKEYQMSGNKFLENIIYFKKPEVIKAIQLVKLTLLSLGTSFYLYKEKLIFSTKELLKVLRKYLEVNILVEIFALSIQELVSNIYYSEMISGFTVELIFEVIELLLQVGWRNLFYLSDYNIPSLNDFIKKEDNFTCYSRHIAVLMEFFKTSRVRNLMCKLTYPSGESERLINEEIDNKLKLTKPRNKELQWDYFTYQRDTSIVMHYVTNNMINFFTCLNKSIQELIMPYIILVLHLEIKNETSKIINQSLILNELISWVNSTNIERNIYKEQELLDGDKVWILDDQILHISAKENLAQIVLRNIVSKVSFKLEVDYILDNSLKDHEQNYFELEQLLTTNSIPDVSAKSDTKIMLTPEYVISLLPESIQRRFNERIFNWNPIKVTPKIKELLNMLDSYSIYNLHTISVLYLNKDCNLHIKYR